MITILPTILETDLDHARQRIRTLSGVCEIASLDMMDGVFVPNTTLYDAQDLEDIETPLKLEVHLMVKDVERVLNDWMQHPNVVRILFHFEATGSPSRIISLVHGKNLEVGMVINPDTPLSAFDHVAHELSVAQVMGVHPGFSGQEFVPDTVDRVKKLHQRFPELRIQVDGGVNDKTISALAEAGATSFCVGSFLQTQIPEHLQLLYRLASSTKNS